MFKNYLPFTLQSQPYVLTNDWPKNYIKPGVQYVKDYSLQNLSPYNNLSCKYKLIQNINNEKNNNIFYNTR